MQTKKDLIQRAIRLQEELSHIVMEFKIEKWLALDLTIVQFKSVMYIYSKGEVSYKELAEALNVAPSVVTGIVDRLISHGMVKRKQLERAADRRVQWLVVSEKGKALLDDIWKQTGENTAQILESLNEENLSALVEGTSSLIKAAKIFFENQFSTKTDTVVHED